MSLLRKPNAQREFRSHEYLPPQTRATSRCLSGEGFALIYPNRVGLGDRRAHEPMQNAMFRSSGELIAPRYPHVIFCVNRVIFCVKRFLRPADFGAVRKKEFFDCCVFLWGFSYRECGESVEKRHLISWVPIGSLHYSNTLSGIYVAYLPATT
jgi:hypothetical protein